MIEPPCGVTFSNAGDPLPDVAPIADHILQISGVVTKNNREL